MADDKIKPTTDMHSDAAQAIDPEAPANGKDASAKKKEENYWGYVKRQYRRKRLAYIAFWFIIFMSFVAVFADFLASDRPIICSYEETFYSPVVHEYLVGIWNITGIDVVPDYPPKLLNAAWKDLEYDWAIWPPLPYRPDNTDLLNSFAAPFNGENPHILGTDQLGRDILAGLIHGSRVSLSIGIISVLIQLIIGLSLGSLAGYYGGWVDIVISRLIELFLNFPTLFLILTIVAFLGPNIFYVMIIIGLTGWMPIARFVRGEVLRVRNMEYVTAANSVGFSDARIIFRHVLPNSVAPVLVAAAFGVATAILIEASLSFLGFGVPAEVVTWGSALNLARSAPYAWWLAIFPGMMIFLTVTAFNLIGDGLRDATDPRLKV